MSAPDDSASRPTFDYDDARLARDYEELSAERQLKTGQALAERLALKHGEHVLDVGCGTGLLAEHMADLVGPTGMVLGIDPLPKRIAIAKRRGREWLAFDVGDANDLSVLSEDSFDVVVLNAVFHWLPDKARPLKEFRRVLKKGGRIGLTTRPPGERTPLQEIRSEVLAEVPYVDYRQALERSLFRVDKAGMEQHLKEAGFRKIDVRVVPSEQVFADAITAIRYSEASSFGNFLGHLPDKLRDQARAEIARRLDAKRAGKPIVRSGERLMAVAYK